MDHLPIKEIPGLRKKLCNPRSKSVSDFRLVATSIKKIIVSDRAGTSLLHLGC